MAAEFSKLFVPPSELFREVPATPLTFFRGLMRFQYEFDEETLDQGMLGLQKAEYYKALSSVALAVVKNSTNPRFRQVGSFMGFSMGKLMTTFGDCILELLPESDLLLIKKALISPEANISVIFLDKNDWERILQKGKLVGYQPNTDNTLPKAWYIAEVDGKTIPIDDWPFTGGSDFRFEANPPDSN